MSGTPGADLFLMVILALPVACVAWTVTHEEVFREPREYCVRRSKTGRRLIVRKFFYLFTCEYCFSHYVTLATLFLTDATLLFDDWRGSILAFFTIVWIANQYMSLFVRLRLDIKRERVEIGLEEQAVQADNKQK